MMLSDSNAHIELLRFVRPLKQAVQTTFQAVMGINPILSPIRLICGEASIHKVSAVIRLTSGCPACLIVSCDERAALQLASTMLRKTISVVDAVVADVVGELCNLIVGSAKANLSPLSIMSLPKVVIDGAVATIRGPRVILSYAVPCGPRIGLLTIEISY